MSTIYEYDHQRHFKIKYATYFISLLIFTSVIMLTVLILTDSTKNSMLITKDIEVIGRVSKIEREHGIL
jgi:hypothetical protein